jgi:hypothetical protein
MTDFAAVERCFAEWFLGGACLQFAIPVRVVDRTSDCLTLTIATPTPLVAYMRDHEICVRADIEGEFWDLLFSWDSVEPVEVPTGYKCKNCIPPHDRVYPTREALWCDHLFTPFLHWVNEKLAVADAIGFYGDPSSMSWAKLLFSGWQDEKPVHVIRLRP